MFSFARFTLEN